MPAADPVIVLGVRRSGTTLLRVMLDRNAALAVPDESYFVPQLARRHRDCGRPRGVRRRPASPADARRVGRLARGRRAAASPGHADGRGDRGRVRGVRRRARQGALGRQDAALHAAPPAARAALSRRALRPPDPGRPRRGALVPLGAGGDHDGGRGGIRATPPASRASGRPRCAPRAALGAPRRAGPLPRGPLRGARRGRRRPSSGASATSPGSSTTTGCSATSGRPTPRARRTSSGSTSRRASACATGGREMSADGRRGVRGRRGRPARRARLRRGDARVTTDGRLAVIPREGGARGARWESAVTQRSPLWRRRHPPAAASRYFGPLRPRNATSIPFSEK